MRNNKKRLPRRMLGSKRKPSWRILIVDKRSEEELIKIYFGAHGGGEAKSKALAKLQSFFRKTYISQKIKVDGLLEKQKINGGGNGGVPSYVLREKYSWPEAIMQAKRPSQVFKVS